MTFGRGITAVGVFLIKCLIILESEAIGSITLKVVHRRISGGRLSEDKWEVEQSLKKMVSKSLNSNWELIQNPHKEFQKSSQRTTFITDHS